MSFESATTQPSGSRLNAASGALTLNAGDWFEVTLTGTNGTLSLSGEQQGQDFRLELMQAASGGPYAPTFWSGITWLTADGAAPVMPTTASAVLVLHFKCLGGSTYEGWAEGGTAAGLSNVNGRIATNVTTTSSVQATNALTGLSFAIGASEQWTADFYLAVTGSTAGMIFQLTGPASPTNLRMVTVGNTTDVTAISADTQTAFATGSAAWANNATPFTGFVHIHACINNGTTAGTVALTFAAATSTQSNLVLANSYMAARKIN